MKKITGKETDIIRLPDSELNVMKVIWSSSEPIGIGKLMEVLGDEKNWSRSTIQVLLVRLEEKGFITCKKNGRLKFYIPLIEEEIYCAKETKSFLDHFYNSSYKNLIATLVQDNTIQEEDIEDLINIIRNSRKGS
jgi:predicted transcriptional regulator